MGFWMKKSVFQDILLKIKNNELEIDEALNLLSINGYIDMGHTKFDIERESRTGFPEVVFCETKGKDEFFDIVKHLIKEKHFSLLTRLKSDQFEVLKTSFKDKKNINLYEKARIAVIGNPLSKRGLVSILTGGTSDIPIAEEAAVTSETFGCNVKRYYDVGVAGIHRLFSHWEEIRKSNVIIAVAGMEGALPSVIAGLYGGPVIAVPTSIGYGANFSGIAPLLSMLNSCSPGVSVVNIDNGFGAGFIASSINKRIEDARENE